jgi:hypothetical protein
MEEEMDGACNAWGERSVFIILVGEPEGKRPLGRPRHGWENNINTLLKQGVWVRTGFNWLRRGSSGGFL